MLKIKDLAVNLQDESQLVKRTLAENVEKFKCFKSNDGIKNFLIGSVCDNTTIASIFGCGTQGGMRRSRTINTLVIFSDHIRGIYDDSTMLYTGMGQEGEQILDGNQNKTMYESRKNGINIHLFETFKPGEHMYRGQVKLIEDPYIDYQ